MKKLLSVLCALCLLAGSAAFAEVEARVLVPFSGAEALAELAPVGNLTYVAKNAIDGKLDTCWAYNQGETPGATITFFPDEPVMIGGIRFTPGYFKSEALLMANNRVKRVLITLSDGTEYDADVKDGGIDDWAEIMFDEPNEAEWIRLAVLEVYPGDKYDDTCISEVEFFE